MTAMPVTDVDVALLVASAACFLTFGLGVLLPLLVGSGRRATASQAVELDAWARSPSIDVIVPAYLEASVIGTKVTECRAALQEYAGIGRIVVIASDPETASAARLAGADDVKEIGRTGKPAAVNAGISASAADIVVLSDANCSISPLRWPSIVAAELETAGVISANKTEQGGAEGAFWAYERVVKTRQGEGNGSSLSVVGEFVALRRELFRPLPAEEIIDDLWIAVDFRKRGYAVRISPSLTTVEVPPGQRDQWERRVRIAQGMLSQHVTRLRTYLSFEGGRNFALHKFYRLTAGCAAFWAALILASLAWLPVLGVAIAIVMGYSVLRYSGILVPSRPAGPITVVLGMQAVPVAALLRLACAKSRRNSRTVGWKKIAR